MIHFPISPFARQTWYSKKAMPAQRGEVHLEHQRTGLDELTRQVARLVSTMTYVPPTKPMKHMKLQHNSINYT